MHRVRDPREQPLLPSSLSRVFGHAGGDAVKLMATAADIRSIAVHREDVVTALEATLRSDRDVVLRITPPFSGRMRARIHDRSDVDRSDERSGSGEAADSIHLSPAELVDDVPPYPEPDETAQELRSSDCDERTDSEGYDIDEHYDRHSTAVAKWRETVGASVSDRVTVGDGAAAHEIDVFPLG